jgi:hypothetical protein
MGPFTVVAGLVPAISIMEALRSAEGCGSCLPYRDRRDKPGDDGGWDASLYGPDRK